MNLAFLGSILTAPSSLPDDSLLSASQRLCRDQGSTIRSNCPDQRARQHTVDDFTRTALEAGFGQLGQAIRIIGICLIERLVQYLLRVPRFDADRGDSLRRQCVVEPRRQRPRYGVGGEGAGPLRFTTRSPAPGVSQIFLVDGMLTIG